MVERQQEEPKFVGSSQCWSLTKCLHGQGPALMTIFCRVVHANFSFDLILVYINIERQSYCEYYNYDDKTVHGIVEM